MAKVDLFNMDGKVVGEFELSDAIFGIEPKQHLILQVVKAQLANRRQGTAKTKGRSEVRGGGRKPYRQKGTGRARQGSTRSAQWVGGGPFGPPPRQRVHQHFELAVRPQVQPCHQVSEAFFTAPM